MKKHILLAAAASLALMPAAFAQGQPAGDRSGQMSQGAQQIAPADQTFVNKAAVSNMFEVDTSELAVDKAESSDVKEFARHMIRDHGKAGKELETLAKNLGAEVPEELDAKHSAALEKLEQLDGAAFDQAYIQAQREAHREAVNLFSSYSRSGSNDELQAWAQKTLPVLQEHAREVQQVSGVAQRGGGESNMGRASAGEDMKQAPAPKNQ